MAARASAGRSALYVVVQPRICCLHVVSCADMIIDLIKGSSSQQQKSRCFVLLSQVDDEIEKYRKSRKLYS